MKLLVFSVAKEGDLYMLHTMNFLLLITTSTVRHSKIFS